MSEIKALLTVGAVMVSLTATAQWSTQTISLRPGWNAVYLEVLPQPEECDAVFAGVPVESVWMWNRRFSSVQFLQDPDKLIPGQLDWLVYIPPTKNPPSAVNLFMLLGGRSYLIKLADNAAPTTLSLRGKPALKRTDWVSDSWNFVGFSVSTTSPVTFQSFFAGSQAHVGQPIYRLNNASGQWEPVQPSTTTLRSGEAVWVYTKGQSTYPGPASIALDEATGLNYGRLLTEQTLRIRNNSQTAKTFKLRLLPSETPPVLSQPVLGGPVALSYYRLNLSAVTNDFGWVRLPSVLSNAPIAPGAEWVVRLAVRRAELVPYNGAIPSAGLLFQSLLEVSDEGSFRQLVPVTTEGLQRLAPQGPRLASVSGTAHPRAGLWVGNAVINAVNQPSNPSAPDLPVPVSSPYQVRLLVHVDETGNARLLQKVLQMWKDAVTNGQSEIVTPGHFVLVTDESLTPMFKGSTLRDGVQVARRLSSTSFGFRDPILFGGTGSFGLTNGPLLVRTSILYDDPLNPFVHRYHPDHNNLDERFEKTLPEGQESFSVTRDIQLNFTAEDPEKLSIAGLGDNQLTGNYREVVTGLHRSKLYLQGIFRLTQASRVAQLNDGIHN